MNTPLVSCICPTYGRPPDFQFLLEEAIESFLRQDYPNKELVVFNDCPGQVLVCDAPGVRVVNVPGRFPTLGDKYNAAISLAHGDLLAPWEDDDISLPWRLSLSVERIGDADYFNPQRYWFLDDAGLHSDHPMGYGHNLSLFTRTAFEAVGGYPALSGPQDAAMDSALRSKVGCVESGTAGQEELPRSEWYYIYRWGVHPVHLSGSGTPENFYQEVGTRPVQSGSYRLHPHWRVDYEAAVSTLMEGPTRTKATPRILEATYGAGESVSDVTTQLQELVRQGRSLFTVSNSLFGDPCPNQLKTLRITYQLPEDDQQHTDEVPEHQVVLLHDHSRTGVGIA